MQGHTAPKMPMPLALILLLLLLQTSADLTPQGGHARPDSGVSSLATLWLFLSLSLSPGMHDLACQTRALGDMEFPPPRGSV